MLFETTTTAAETETSEAVEIGIGFAFDWDTGRYRMENGSPAEVTGEEAVKEWLRQVIHTPAGMAIYPADFGCSAVELMHKKLPRGYALSELSRQLAASAAHCHAIRDISALHYDGTDILCTVTMNDETTTQEVIAVEP